MWLLDTNVVSELRRKRPSRKVEPIYLSVVTIGEIQLGIEKIQDLKAERAIELNGWLDVLAAQYNVVDLDAAMWRLWAKLIHTQDRSLYEDALIAATALIKGYCVVTRNVRNFARWDAKVVDPFA
jgi:predicted nucleic acid-binding protein